MVGKWWEESGPVQIAGQLKVSELPGACVGGFYAICIVHTADRDRGDCPDYRRGFSDH